MRCIPVDLGRYGTIAVRLRLLANGVEFGLRNSWSAKLVIVDAMSVATCDVVDLTGGSPRGGAKLIVDVAAELDVIARKFADLKEATASACKVEE